MDNSKASSTRQELQCISSTYAEYIDFSIMYRVLSITLSSAAYLFSMLYFNMNHMRNWVILVGMMLSSMLAIYLYKKLLKNEEKALWFYIIISIELFAYGLFAFFSGGFASPYLWYYVGCLFILITANKNQIFAIIATSWCLICALVSHFFYHEETSSSYLEFNIFIGVILVVGALYLVSRYVNQLEQNRIKQQLLYSEISYEKQQKEQALNQLSQLYETFSMFAITAPDKIMEELTALLKKSIAPGGCVLIRLDMDGEVELSENIGMSSDNLEKLKDQWQELVGKEELEKAVFIIDGAKIECFTICQGKMAIGAFVRNLQKNPSQEQDAYYMGFIDMIFRNLEIQKQLEAYIATEEKNRLADEIHDTVIQKLFGMVCTLSVLEKQSTQMDQEQILKQIHMLKESAEHTMKELREAIYGRSFENGYTFISSLEQYLEEAKRLNDTRIELEIDSNVEQINTSQKIGIYRIVCEAVNNAIRHGKATIIQVIIQIDSSYIFTQVIDNGIGMHLSSNKPLEGNGMKNMKHMATLLKGKLLVETEADGGVAIRVKVPRL